MLMLVPRRVRNRLKRGVQSLQRLSETKKGRLLLGSLLGAFGFIVFAGVFALLNTVYGPGGDVGKPYYKLGNDRVLLMNRDDNPLSPVKVQGWSDKSSSADYRWEMLASSTVSGSGSTYVNLQQEHHSRYLTKAGNRLWELINCRHGNTNPKKTKDDFSQYQNYLPYSATSYCYDDPNYTVDKMKQYAGTIVFQNTNTAQVVSSCYDEGIGTIYFDAVNGWTEYLDGQLKVQVCYGVYATNENGTVSGEFARDIEGNLIPPTDDVCDSLSVNIAPDGTETQEFAAYGRCAWVDVNLAGLRITNGVAEAFAPTNTLTLDIKEGKSMKSYFRVWAPVQDPALNPELAKYCRGKMRFRIVRQDTPSDTLGFGMDGGYFNSSKRYRSALIVVDNVIASYPAMQVGATAKGEYVPVTSGKNVVGWTGVFSSKYPAAGEEGLYVEAGIEAVSNTPPAQTPAIDFNPANWISKASMTYRWRYLE